MSQNEVTRKKPKEIVKAIFNELGKNGGKTANEIALAIGSNASTVKKYLGFIELCQEGPRIKIMRTSAFTAAEIVEE
jgi:DNA invertase Pin-like site-specific DNA recombinase